MKNCRKINPKLILIELQNKYVKLKLNINQQEQFWSKSPIYGKQIKKVIGSIL